MREQIWHYYFKDQHYGYPLMSGAPLPKDPDGIVRNKSFHNCTFHPNCQDVTFDNCEFVDCDK